MQTPHDQTRCRVWRTRHQDHQNSPLRVLVVDDYVLSADALAAYLSACDIEARVAYGGHEALTTTRLWKPQAIVLDLAMPVVSGEEVADALRHDQSTASIALLAYTAHDQYSGLTRIRECGFDAFCMKPADPRLLTSLIEHLVGRKSTSH